MRTRIGIVVPSINVTAEDELIAMAGPGIGLHFARAVVDRSLTLAGQFEGMVRQLPDLSVSLAHAGVAAVAFACTSASFFQGPGSDRAVSDSMNRASGLPAVSTATAVADALSHLGATRVAVATPYVRWVYEAEGSFLESRGFQVTAITGLDTTGGTQTSGIGSDEVRRLVEQVDSPEAEAILVSCTDLPSAHLVEELEARYGKPVVTSNQATFWAAARLAGLEEPGGVGSLFRSAA